MKNINEMSSEDIRAEYRERYSSRTGAIVFDGIVNDSEYENILFFLKEANQENATECETKPINENLNENAPWGMIWNRAAEWVYGISNTTPTQITPYKDMSPKEKHNEIKKIAVININKADGTGSPTQEAIEGRLMDAVDNNSDLLKREIDLVKPKIIICGGTYWYLRRIYGNEIPRCDDYKNYIYTNIDNLHNVLIIDFCHPAFRCSPLITYYGLTGLYQQALISKLNK